MQCLSATWCISNCVFEARRHIGILQDTFAIYQYKCNLLIFYRGEISQFFQEQRIVFSLVFPSFFWMFYHILSLRDLLQKKLRKLSLQWLQFCSFSDWMVIDGMINKQTCHQAILAIDLLQMLQFPSILKEHFSVLQLEVLVLWPTNSGMVDSYCSHQTHFHTGSSFQRPSTQKKVKVSN